MRVLVFLALVTSFAAAQSDSANSPVRVCISVPTNLSHLSISPPVQRDRLVHFINTSAQKKNAKVRIDAIPVDGSDLREAAGASEEQQCPYLVLSEFDLNKNYTGGSGPGYDPMMKNGTANTRRASLNYRVLRVGNRSNIDDGLITLPDDSDEDSAATDGIRQLSVRVVSAVTKQKARPVD